MLPSRCFSHILKVVCKALRIITMPTITDLNPATTVCHIGNMLLIAAPKMHALPADLLIGIRMRRHLKFTSAVRLWIRLSSQVLSLGVEFLTTNALHENAKAFFKMSLPNDSQVTELSTSMQRNRCRPSSRLLSFCLCFWLSHLLSLYLLFIISYFPEVLYSQKRLHLGVNFNLCHTWHVEATVATTLS